MRALIYICCLFCLVNYASAQDATIKADTGKQPLYIIDNKPGQDISTVKPGDIIEVSIKDSVAAIKLYGPKALHGAVVVTTIPMAILQYQKKLSLLNKKYADYLAQKGNDNKLLYVIDNTMLREGVKKSVRELYELSPDDIVKVDFKKDRRFTNDATVVITTKQDNDQ